VECGGLSRINVGGRQVNKRQRGILALCAIAFVVIFLFPPYMAMDRTSPGTVHAGVGLHPVWAPPGSDHVLAVFAEEGVTPEGGVQATDLDIRVNKVGFVFEIIALVLFVSAALFALRSRGRPGEEPAR
jgi:hypothetical protein